MSKINQTSKCLLALLFILPGLGSSTGCGGSTPTSEEVLSATLTDDSAQKKHPDMAHSAPDMAHGGGGGDMGAFPPANPPPASCDMRSSGVTGIQVVVRIDTYQGLITGRNGTHEIAYGTVIDTPWVFNAGIVDTTNVQLAMNVASAKDSAGLPHEIRLAAGQILEVEGEYIPASTAHAHDANGAAAVIHFSHNPCGYVVIAGTTYK